MKPLFPALLGALLCAVPAPAQPLDTAIEHYLAGRFAESVTILDALLDAEPGNVDARVWIGSGQLRMDNPHGALAFADAALEMAPCHSAAHNLAATVYSLEPWDAGARELVRTHVQKAVECDPDDGNAWLTYWVSGVMRQDGAAQALAQRRVGELRFIPEPVMEQARWILRSTPRNAVLFTSGDWDFFPIMVAQSHEGLRPDVEVALLSMLTVPWYVQALAERTGWPVPPELSAPGGDDWSPAEAYTDQMASIAGHLWAQAALDGGRPLTIPTTALPDFVGDVGWLRWDGPVFTLLPWDQAPQDTVLTIDTGAFAASMRHLDIARLHGPVVHPTDRSPIRRAAVHPASFILYPVTAYGMQSVDAGRMDEARQALAWADQLVATGHASAEDAARVEELRAAAGRASP
jgi:tetratricopeptide (TPR) repeat protein